MNVSLGDPVVDGVIALGILICAIIGLIPQVRTWLFSRTRKVEPPKPKVPKEIKYKKTPWDNATIRQRKSARISSEFNIKKKHWWQ